MNILISLFGLLIVDRFFSQFENLRLISRRNRNIFFIFCSFPLFFKEHRLFNNMYIGIFLISLISSSVFFHIKMKKIFEKTQILLLNSIILNMRTGISAQNALEKTILSLNYFEKRAFESLLTLSSSIENRKIKTTEAFLVELELILKSKTHLLEQLISFREGIKIQNSLRHRSKQASYQPRAQAIVCLFIYGLIFVVTQAQMASYTSWKLMTISIGLLLIGEVAIFLMGRRISWSV